MIVDIYADIVCPWCYIGHVRFAQAVRSFEHADDVEIRLRPYQLDPAAPLEPTPLRDYLYHRYGTRGTSMIRAAEDAAHAEGLSVDFHRAVAANTFTAHRLLALALAERGAEDQRRLAEALYAAHFQHGENVGDIDVLARHATDVGMGSDYVRAYLLSEEGEDALRAALREAQALGIRAVPTYILDGKYAVQGAQPASTMLQVLNEVAAESA